MKMKTYLLALTAVIAATAALHAQEMAPVAHNGSQAVWSKDTKGRVEIRYSMPRAGLPVKDGDLLFEGNVDTGGTYTGTAYLFKAGCAPAPYAVQGKDVGGDIVLVGQAPLRKSGGCELVGSSAGGRNSRLVFSFEPA
jgi:hypothetical protein